MNASSISRIVRANTKLEKSSTGKGRVSDVSSEGYICQQDGDAVKVIYTASSLRYSEKGWQEYLEREHGALYLMAKVLRRKNYAVIVFDNMLVVQASVITE